MAIRRWLPLIAALVLGTGCDKKTGVPAKPESSSSPVASGAPVDASARPSKALTPIQGDPERGRKVAEKFECNRCHQGSGLAPAKFEKHCVTCHQDIRTGKFKPLKTEKLAQWKRNVAEYEDVPSFEALGARLEPAWIAAFLREPVDLRPHLISTMPRLAITAEEAADVAAYLTKGSPQAGPPELGKVEAGRIVLEAKGCGSCHAFSGVAALPVQPDLAKAEDTAKHGIRLAPDLRFTRDRFVPSALVRWLRDPQAVKPGTLMPNMALSEQEAKDAAAYLLQAPLAPPVARPALQRLPVLDRAVAFEEVDEKVLSKTCRHCHTNPDVARGDGGPGMTGGFGFVPRKLDLSSYESVASGLLDAKGERMSVFAASKDGTPRLLASLVARHGEEAGSANPDVRGMPLGLPPLTPEQIQIVESWIAQGRPK